MPQIWLHVRCVPGPSGATGRWFVLDAEANINLDLTAADALEEHRARLADRGLLLAATDLRSNLRTALTQTGWVVPGWAPIIFSRPCRLLWRCMKSGFATIRPTLQPMITPPPPPPPPQCVPKGSVHEPING